MRLILMRHAKSDWAAGCSDHERPLNPRGRAAAPAVAAALVAQGFAPAVALASDAVRTQETWEAMAPALPGVAVQLTGALYLAQRREIVAALAGLAGPGPVLVLGHNPGLSEAVAWLSQGPCELKTADAALLESDAVTWAAACAGPGRFRRVALLSARGLGAGGLAP